MILKLLLVIGVIGIVYFFFIKKKPAITKSTKKTKEDKAKEEDTSNEMVECSTCGTYCELDDTILSSSKYYCSNECLEKA